jgi:beta-lactamase class A
MLNRREFGIACVAASIVGARAEAYSDPSAQIAVLEASLGGRMGVSALDTGSGRRIDHRGDERFAMCSTFKWLLAATVLARADEGALALSQPISYTADDLPSHSPITRAHLGQGAMDVEAMCAAAVEESDNGAANLLLRTIGGPASVTEYARSLGDSLTRLDRTELALNENRPGDQRDTTTPNAAAADLHRVLLADALRPRSRERLIGWMRNCQTGLDRLRAGLPPGWVVADKTGTGTGTGATSAANDIAVAWPPGHPPIIIASYISGSAAALEKQSAAHARIGRIVAAAFA